VSGRTTVILRQVDGDGIELAEDWWPARLLVDRAILRGAQAAPSDWLHFDGERLTFSLMNAEATYRVIEPSVPGSVPGQGVVAFDCVRFSRELMREG
jgi:hypothetical protein